MAHPSWVAVLIGVGILALFPLLLIGYGFRMGFLEWLEISIYSISEEVSLIGCLSITVGILLSLKKEVVLRCSRCGITIVDEE